MDCPWTAGFQGTGQFSLGQNNLVGDGQADLSHHGGPEKLCLLYAAEHYHPGKGF